LRTAGDRALRDAGADEDEDRGDERVGRQREEDARLAHAAQVRDGDQRDAGERERDLVPAQRRHRRRQCEDPGGDRDGDGQHVVGEQRGRADEARQLAEVLLRDDVRAAARLVRPHGLPVGEDDDREQPGDRERKREDDVRRGGGRGDEHDECRLGRVRHRGQRVGREDRQRERLRQQRLVQLARRHRAADDDPLDPRPPDACGRAHGEPSSSANASSSAARSRRARSRA
jgi:hypothetical protein